MYRATLASRTTAGAANNIEESLGGWRAAVGGGNMTEQVGAVGQVDYLTTVVQGDECL